MAESSLAPAVVALGRALSAPGLRYMIIGGVAVIAHGVRRLTDDVDGTLWAPGVHVPEVLEILSAQQIRARIPDALEFAEESQVLLLKHEPSNIDIDLSLAWLPFEDEALDGALKTKLGRGFVRVARPEDLIIYKAIAGRERDRSDIERLLELHEDEMDLERVKKTVGELSEALERPEVMADLDSLIRRAKERR